jgi:hypothetical protein
MSFCFLTPIAKATQQEAQELCVEKIVNRCVEQCQKTNKIINCTQTCEANARNQCLQAGE